MGFLSMYVDALVNSFKAQFKDRRYFDLATPDPGFEFSNFTVRPEDQLPGRPIEGRIEVTRFSEHFTFFLTDSQQKVGGTNGSKIYNELKERKLPVLGPNVGQYLYEHQELIPVELRGKKMLVFWGKVYRDSSGYRCVRSLDWDGERWRWDYGWIGLGRWSAYGQVVLLAR